MFELRKTLASMSQKAEWWHGRQILAWWGVLLGALASLATPAPHPCSQGEEDIRDQARVVFVEQAQIVKLRLTSSGPCAVVEAGDFDLVECPHEPRGDGGYGGVQLDSGEYSPRACGELCTCGQAQDETFCVARRGANSVDVAASFSFCRGEDNEEKAWVKLEVVSD